MKYGLNVKLQYRPRNMTEILAKSSASAPPAFRRNGIMVVTDAHHATLWVKKCTSPLTIRVSASIQKRFNTTTAR